MLMYQAECRVYWTNVGAPEEKTIFKVLLKVKRARSTDFIFSL
jgi:hypothetical protein